VSHAGAVEAIINSWEKSRPVKIMIVTIDNPTGHDLLKIADWMKGKGVNYLGHEFMPLTPVDITPYMERIAKANPDWIISIQTTAGYSALIKEMNARNLATKLVVPLFPGLGVLEKQVGIELMKSVYQVTPFAPYTATDEAGVATLVEYSKKYASDFYPPNPMYFNGWTTGIVMKSAIEAAVDKVGWDNLTGKEVYKALKQGSFDFQGILPPLTYGENNRASLSVHLEQVDKEKGVTVVSPWMKTTYSP
jgi:ABC-type branched-subunit amino acid transport system substrate-binding protein